MVAEGIDTGYVWANIILIITGLSGGGVAVALLEGYITKLAKKREEYVHTTHEKLKHLANNLAILVNLIGYAKAFATSLGIEKDKDNNYGEPGQNKPIDEKRALYYLCCFTQCFEDLNNSGGLQLDDFDAEDIIYGFINEFWSLYYKEFNYEYRHFMVRLVRRKDNSIRDYIDFLKAIESNHNSPRSSEIMKWILKMGFYSRISVYENLYWAGKLLNTEINHIYRLYYGRDPDIHKELDEDLLKRLKIRHVKYHKRLKGFKSSYNRHSWNLS